MKKVVLSGIALFVAGIGFSQVTDLNGNTSTDPTVIAALPGAGAGANTGLSVQYGNAQRVRVRQAGTSQSAYTVQDNGLGTGGNQALVRQTGAVGPNSGVRNAAMVLQSGTTNSSLTRQEGDRNKATTRQGQNDGASANNKAYIRQGVANQAERNFAGIDQDGNRNLASTVQTYDNSDAWTQQTGDDNKSMINQDAGPNGTAGHYASVQQNGELNESTVMQQGAGSRNTAYTWQDGAENQAKQFQDTDATSGPGEYGHIQQGATVTFDPIIDAIFPAIGAADPNGLPVYTSDFESFGAKAKQTQLGSRNSAAIMQAGGTVGFSNYAEQEQLAGSSRNTAGILQGHYYVGEAGNYAKQSQDGDRNDAAMSQSGSGHKGLQTQYGSRNNAFSTQRGENHMVNVHQRGNRNAASTAQGGSGNKALVVQWDGQSYTVEQNLDLGGLDRSAGGNQADILQVGPDGGFGSPYAIDCDFDDPMNLDMDFDVPMVMNPDICTDCNN